MILGVLHPDWFGSPQHVVGGAAVALAAVISGRFPGLRPALSVALGVGLASTAELLVELVKYPLMYADEFHASAYYDTLADIASTLVGAALGAVSGACWIQRRDRDRDLSVGIPASVGENGPRRAQRPTPVPTWPDISKPEVRG